MRVGVIGAGLAGVMTAAELRRRGADVTVFEANDRIGGLVDPIADGGFVLEPGGSGFNLPHPALDHFVTEFGLEVVPAQGAHRRYLARSDRLIELPASPPAMLVSPVLSGRAKARLLREPAVTSTHGEGETLLGFMTRRFGDEAGRLAAHLAATGVFVGDPAELSVEAAFPRLVSLEHRSGSVLRGMIDARRSRGAQAPSPRLYVPATTMSSLVRALAADLAVRTGCVIDSVRPSAAGWELTGTTSVEVDEVVVALDPASASRVVPDRLAPLLDGRPTAPVAVVGLGSHSGGPAALDGFGALSHPDAGLVSLGVLFESSYAPHRAPPDGFLVKVIAGGAVHPEVASWTDDYLVRVVGAELAAMLGENVEADWVRVERRRIPQYQSGHLRWLSKVDEVVASMPGLHLTGWGYRGVGIAHVASDALAVTDRITRG